MRMMLDLLHASHCRSTHHKLALDALHHLRCPGRERWARLFLKHYERYLQGAKDPDTKFRDFRNHVLHVRDNYWGGAITAAELWYHEVVESLRARDFAGAVYAAGVLSHYVTDPVMPFHTGQSQAETNIHRAAEWSVATSYDALVAAAAARQAPPRLEPPAGSDWLAEVVIAGAEEANRYYEALIEHYDFALGSRNPPAGWDATGREIIGRLLVYAAASYAQVLERAILEADVDPPHVELWFATVFATMQVPVRYVARRIDDYQQRRWIEAMYEEWRTTGRVEETLPADDRAIRDLYHREVVATRATSTTSALRMDHAERNEALARARAAVGSKPSRGDFQRQREEQGRTSRRHTSSVEPAAAQPRSVGENVVAPRLDEAHPQPARRSRLAAARSSVTALSSRVRERIRRRADTAPEESAAELDGRQQGGREDDPRQQVDDIDRRLEALAGQRSLAASPQAAEPRFSADEHGDQESAIGAEQHEAGEDRFYLDGDSPVHEAPSIGAKTARRLAATGVRTIDDLLAIKDYADAIERIGQRWITEQTLQDWQDQASLAVRIPNLRGHDAQILVACGFRLPQEIAAAKPADILKVTIPFCDSAEGKRILRGSKSPDKHEVRNWIEWAGRAR